jgi:hypothetical protein
MNFYWPSRDWCKGFFSGLLSVFVLWILYQALRGLF